MLKISENLTIKKNCNLDLFDKNCKVLFWWNIWYIIVVIWVLYFCHWLNLLNWCCLFFKWHWHIKVLISHSELLQLIFVKIFSEWNFIQFFQKICALFFNNFMYLIELTLTELQLDRIWYFELAIMKKYQIFFFEYLFD